MHGIVVIAQNTYLSITI